MMKKNTQPNYKRIYSDIIDQKFPHKKAECQKLLNKKNLSSIDILKLNKKSFWFHRSGIGKGEPETPFLQYRRHL
jgi:hypothetical protein